MNYSIGKIIQLKEFAQEKFIITNKIEGAFGIVFFLNSVLGTVKPCVIKILKDNVDIIEARREALLWSRIGYHNNIAQYICFGEVEDKPYILSEKYSRTLADVTQKEINNVTIGKFLLGVLTGLEFAYRKLELIHRDLKPNNIFLDNDNIKIGDFGLSSYEYKKLIYNIKNKNLELTQLHSNRSFGGTIPFMAPETLFSNIEFSIKTDIYSLGVTFFSIITNGMLPYIFPSFNKNENAFKAFCYSNISDNIKNIILKCIDINYITRYNNYKQIFNDLGLKYIEADDGKIIYDTINYIQTLRKSDQHLRAELIISDILQSFPDHPLVINQMAIIEKEKGNQNKYIEILKLLFKKDVKYKYDQYWDPLFNYANYYFENNELLEMKKLLDDNKYLINENNTELFYYYPEYCVYCAINKNFLEAFKYLGLFISQHNIHPLYTIFYFVLSMRINQVNFAIEIIEKMNNETSRLILNTYRKLNTNELLLVINNTSKEHFGGLI